MSRTRCSYAVVALTVLLSTAGVTSAQSPEFRAMWASRFDWPLTSQSACKARIDTIMQNLKDARFNAVFFQVRGQADVFYPSPDETWSPILDETDPGWDPLAYAINAAHSRGLEFHAYINTHTCWQSDPATAHTLPADPNHVFWKHCNLADPNAHDWLHDPGYPVQFNESDYVWFAPGVPDFQAHVRHQVLYVVENYDVDGVHFDRIRTPGTNLPSYDAISLARYADPQSNPNNLDFRTWTADQITRLVSDIHGAILAVKPNVKVSAAVYPSMVTAPTYQHQDALAWSAAGGMDMLVPMMYYSGGAGSPWDVQLQSWLAQNTGYAHIIAGHITTQGVTSLIDQINLTRTDGAHGNSVFSWGSFSYWNSYRTLVYQQTVPTPTMQWKTDPVEGTVVGRVFTPDGAPLLDAQVYLPALSYRALSCADGFFALLRIPPGTYTLSARHPAYPSRDLYNIQVAAGQVVWTDIIFSETAPVGDFNDDGQTNGDDVLPFFFCMAGPGHTFQSGHYCRAGDSDDDGDIDLHDLAVFQEVCAD